MDDRIYLENTSSKGNQTKFKEDTKWYKLDYLGYESASEYLASEILKQSNIKNFVEYDIEIIEISGKVKKVCVSDDFLKNQELITLDTLIKANYGKSLDTILKGLSLSGKIKKTVDIVEEITKIKNFGQYLTCMLEFDAFILNEDRHFNNICVLKNTDKTYSLCPIFDNGTAFLSDIMQDYPLDKSTYDLINNVTAKPFDKSFDKQIEICESLYGQQLKISKELGLTKAILKINRIYGNEISKRISNIIEHQKYLYSEFLKTQDEIQKSVEPEERNEIENNGLETTDK